MVVPDTLTVATSVLLEVVDTAPSPARVAEGFFLAASKKLVQHW
jgi:hypothetical protein